MAAGPTRGSLEFSLLHVRSEQSYNQSVQYNWTIVKQVEAGSGEGRYFTASIVSARRRQGEMKGSIWRRANE